MLGPATSHVLLPGVVHGRVRMLLRLQDRARGQRFLSATRSRGQIGVEVGMDSVRFPTPNKLHSFHITVTASMAVAPPFRKL